MIKVADLTLGWELWANTECHEVTVLPVFRRRGQKLQVFEMANHPEGHSVFREVKRLVDVADNERQPVSHVPFRAKDVAKFSMELALKMLDKWNPELKETGVELRAL